MKKELISQEQMKELLEKCYTLTVDGIPGTATCEELSNSYLQKYATPEIAAKKFISYQIAKCSASGFITNLGGLTTLPITLPANITSVIYIQMRMVATIACMGGYDIKSDEVQTLVYLCLIKSSIADICKSAGVQITNKVTTNLIKKIPGHILTKINKAVQFRLVTKFGTTGIINLGKLVPVAGGMLGAGVDFFNTKGIAKKAYKVFVLNRID